MRGSPTLVFIVTAAAVACSEETQDLDGSDGRDASGRTDRSLDAALPDGSSEKPDATSSDANGVDTGLLDTGLLDAGSDDAGLADAARDASAPDASLADAGGCAGDGPIELTYAMEFPGGFFADCMPAVAPDPTGLSLDFLRLTNPTAHAIGGLQVQTTRILETNTGREVQSVVVDPFVPWPSALAAGAEWSSLVTKTSGDPVGAAACGSCGRAVSFEVAFESSVGCFVETVEIGTMDCAF